MHTEWRGGELFGRGVLIGSRIALARGDDELRLSFSVWETLQRFAKRSGWRPAGAVHPRSRRRQSVYRPGLIVRTLDARELAAALERFINSDHPFDEIALEFVAAVINFARRGAFEIRTAPNSLT